MQNLAPYRIGAQWRRDSAIGGRRAHTRWQVLSPRMEGMRLHAHREWSERDRETMAAVEAQCWGIADIRSSRRSVVDWLQVDEIADPKTGEVTLINRSETPQRHRSCPRWGWQLNLIWDAYRAGTGGVLMTRDCWAELFGCSPRQVTRDWAILEARGLIETVQLFREKTSTEQLKHDSKLVRPGPRLLELAGLSVYESRYVRTPRGKVDRTEARADAAALRQAARQTGYARQGEHWQSRQRTAAATPRQEATRPRPSPSTRPPVPAPDVEVRCGKRVRISDVAAWTNRLTTPPSPPKGGGGARRGLGGPRPGALPQDPEKIDSAARNPSSAPSVRTPPTTGPDPADVDPHRTSTSGAGTGGRVDGDGRGRVASWRGVAAAPAIPGRGAEAAPKIPSRRRPEAERQAEAVGIAAAGLGRDPSPAEVELIRTAVLTCGMEPADAVASIFFSRDE